MRHYYDVFCLLDEPEVQAFLGTSKYQAHKEKRFRSGDNPVIAKNEAFLVTNPSIRKEMLSDLKWVLILVGKI